MIDDRAVGRWVRIVYWEKKLLCERAGMIRYVNTESIVLSPRWANEEKLEEVTIPQRSVVKYGWCEIFRWFES